MSYKQIKSAIETGATSISVTMDRQPVANNLLVACISSNDGDCTNDGRFSTAINVYDVVDDDFFRIAYGVAPADTSPTITFTNFVGNTKNLSVTEWPCENTTTPLDQTASTGATAPTSVTTIASGTTGATADAIETAIAMTSVRSAISAQQADNGFTVMNSSNGSFSDFSAFKHLTATGAQSCNLSWTTSGLCTGGAIATFRARAYVAPAPRGFNDKASLAIMASQRDDGKWDHAKSADFWWGT